MNYYETILICTPETSEEKISHYIEKIKSVISNSNGEIIEVQKWGRRKLAYKIKGKQEGFYTYIKYKSEGSIPKEVENIFKVTENILRCFTVKIKPKKKIEKSAEDTQVDSTKEGKNINGDSSEQETKNLV